MVCVWHPTDKALWDNYSKDQMKTWKSSDEVNKVHDDLYNPNDSSNNASETYLMLIIKSVFNNEEVITENIIWTQSVLEAIFNVDHLSTKINGDIIETWSKIIKNEGQGKNDEEGEDDEVDKEDEEEVDELAAGLVGVQKEELQEGEDGRNSRFVSNDEELKDFYERLEYDSTWEDNF